MNMPIREKSANGIPKPTHDMWRDCVVCHADFNRLAPGTTGLRGIWAPNAMRWYCSTECWENR
jgi:hypothetical protein